MAQPSAPAAVPKLPRREFRLTRLQLFKALPKHLAWAALTGALAGVLLYFINQIPLEGLWSLALFIPIGAVYVNAAVLPVVIPGRFWSFGYIGMTLLFLLLIIGTILSRKVFFPHSQLFDGTQLKEVNFVTYWGLFTGLMIGLLYGLLAGRRNAMIIGALFGALAGYSIGMYLGHSTASSYARFLQEAEVPASRHAERTAWLRLEHTWQGLAVSLVICNIALHLAGILGAALPADRTITAPQNPPPKPV